VSAPSRHSTALPHAARVWTLAAFSLFLLWAAGERLRGLDGMVVWHDEVFTLVRAFGHSEADIQATLFSGRLLSPADVLVLQGPDPARGWDAALAAFASHPEHAPLYYALARLSALALAPLGVDPVSAARGVSAIAGILIIPAAFVLARLLFGRGAVPWSAALLAGASPMLFLYAQEARQYALWVLMVALSTAALLWAVNQPRQVTRWLLYWLATTLGLYTHLLFALMLPVHGAYALLASRSGPTGPEVRTWSLAAGSALVAFGPWIAVLLGRHQEAANNTEWMARAIGWTRNLGEWSTHLTRLWLDVAPGVPVWGAVLIVPLTLALGYYLVRAPRPAVWLPVGIALVYLGVVLGPDLVLGGSRSQHVRYALPSMLAVLVMVAWVIGTGMGSGRAAIRAASGLVLLTLVLLGAASILAIARADTWWNKQFSATNARIAEALNHAQRPLVIASHSGVTPGELISLAHRLDRHARIWGERGDTMPTIAQFDTVVALMPSASVTEGLGPAYRLEPVPDTWQWFWVRPAGPGSATPEQAP
jgi:uncharacterized membrane protein